jgi:hypothetical protein
VATRHTSAPLPTGLPHGLPRRGEVWALREDSIGCEAYTRSDVIRLCAASKVQYQGYLLCLREPVEEVVANASPSGAPVPIGLASSAARPRRSFRIWCRRPSGVGPGSPYRPATDRRRPLRCDGKAIDQQPPASVGSQMTKGDGRAPIWRRLSLGGRIVGIAVAHRVSRRLNLCGGWHPKCLPTSVSPCLAPNAPRSRGSCSMTKCNCNCMRPVLGIELPKDRSHMVPYRST